MREAPHPAAPTSCLEKDLKINFEPDKLGEFFGVSHPVLHLHTDTGIFIPGSGTPSAPADSPRTGYQHP